MRWLTPRWPVPPGVHAAVTLRTGGVSLGPYASLNLATHVGDDPVAVTENRRRLGEALALPATPRWLTQVHGARVLRVDAGQAEAGAAGGSAPTPQADAAVTDAAGVVLAVLVADCLPVLLASADGQRIGIAHVGWRGLAAGVLAATVGALVAAGTPAEHLRAWLGPSIGPANFEVGEEVHAALAGPQAPAGAADAFERNARGRWQCDLHRLARGRLAALGVHSVHGESHCTVTEADSFYSYRRDGVTGRFAALLWRTPSA